ncbi:hypothetical protein JJV70_06605 [Streptomyces sp. JJ66]|uniref:DUF6251 family protein n=1 Tax=Streptomyces sp. JJ66 TaxID=2803843 RepID=UPI001C580000|nr:DUF6251 family protein [Streptomyces sp. JJ66]MBW1601786.1 hypothetical protein [Streptomyces sp. JJ66]
MERLPEPRRDPGPPVARVVRLPDGTHAYADSFAPPVVHQHLHQAPPDRMLARLALGAGVGAGAVAATVVAGPLLVGALAAIAANLAVLAVLAAVVAWGVVSVVRSVGGSGGSPPAVRVGRARKRS